MEKEEFVLESILERLRQESEAKELVSLTTKFRTRSYYTKILKKSKRILRIQWGFN